MTRRQSKQVPVSAEKAFSNEPLLSEKEVWDVISFARAQSGIYGSGYLTPDLLNNRMKDVSLNPMAASEATLAEAMVNPKQSEDRLRAFSQDFEIRSMPYSRILHYLSEMLSWDILYTSTNAEAKDYTTPGYKKDLKIFENYLDKFDYKKEFTIAVREMLRNDAYFCCPRDTGDKIVLQELPPDYCKITGRWDRGFLFSFNMYYFLLPGVDIDMYPPFFKKKYREIWQDGSTGQNYNPHLDPQSRGSSTWIYWVDISPDVGWCLKMIPELATRLPFFTPLFNDLVLQGATRTLQKNINMSAAARIILGQVPMLNKETKATVKDSIAISPELLGKFMALVKSAISESVKFASAPLEDMKAINFPAENEVYDSYVKTTLGLSGINSNLIFSSEVKPNVVESRLSLGVDEQLMTNLYPQFADFINYFANKLTRHFKFDLNFEGTNFYTDRTDRFETAMSLFDKGIVLPQKISSAIGMKPSVMRRMMEEGNANGFMNLLQAPTKPTLEAQTDSTLEIADKAEATQLKVGKQAAKLAPKPVAGAKQGATKPGTPGDKGGRPKVKDSKLSEEGAQTRSDGSNLTRGGKSI